MSEAASTPALADPAAEQEFLVRLGSAMTFAGESIDEVSNRLRRIGRARGIRDLSIIVLPTALFVQIGRGDEARVQFQSYLNRAIRLDQVSGLYSLVRRAEDPALPAREGIAQLDELLSRTARWGPVIRTLGLGILSIGFSLMLQPTVSGMGIAFVLGCLVGVLRLVHPPGLASIMPYLATFLVASIVFATADHFTDDNPVRTLIPALVTFLPGALMTTGMRDLATGQVISGSSRLVQAIVVLLMLSFSIVAAGALVGLPTSELVDNPHSELGPWAPWVGLIVIATGTFLHHCAPLRATPWILAVLFVAYSGQALGATIFAAELSAFFGALAMTPAVLWIEQLRVGPPALVTFLPAFWLLVPGAAGLLGVTEIVGTNTTLGNQDFIGAMTTVVEISFGVLIGSAVFHTGRAGLQEAAKVLPTTEQVLHPTRWFDRWR